MKSESEQEDINMAEQGAESSLPPVMSSSSLKLTLEELEAEAIAEEEFISDREDEIENPLVYGDDDKLHLESQLHESEVNEKKDALPGAIGTGDLETEGLPFNNEQALREEKMNENNGPLKNDGIETPEQATPDMDFGSVAEDTAVEAETEAPAELNSALGAEMDAMLDAAGDTPVMNMGAEVTDAPVAEPVSETIAPAGETVEAAPVAEPSAPVETPVEAAPTATIADMAADPAVAASVTAAATPMAGAAPKKKKTGLIIGIAAAAVVLIGGGVGAAVYYNSHESAERQVADALQYIWNAKNIQAETTISMESSEKDSDISKMEFSMNVLATENASAINGGKMTITDKDGKTYVLNMDMAYSLDDAIYFKVGGIQTLIDEAIKSADEDEADMEMVAGMLGGIIEVIDDKWIKIDSDSLEEFGGKEAFDCAKEKSKALSTAEFKEKIANLYTENAFIIAKGDKAVKTENDLNYFKIEVNEELAEKFGKAVEELDEVKAFESCGETSDDEDSDYEYDFEDEDEEEDEEESDTEYEILVGITSWEHVPKAIEITATNDKSEMSGTIKVNLAYEEKAVELPGEAKTIKELLEEITTAYMESMSAMMRTQITEVCESMYDDDDMVQECVDLYMEEAEEELAGEIDITDLLQVGV